MEEPHQHADDRASSRDLWRERDLGLLDVLLIIFFYLLISVLLGSAVGLLGFALPSVVGQLLILAAGALAAIFGVGVVVVVRGNLGPASVGLRRVSARWLLIGAGLGLLGWFLTRGVVLAYFWVTKDTSNPQAELVNAARGTPAQFALTLLVAGLAVPIAEEMMFRGVLYTWLRRWGVTVAMVVSALLFGLYHGINVVFPATVVLGLLVAFAYERSGSIWPGVVAHVLYNVIVFSAARLLP